jgi:nucleoside phosphorylase
MSNLTQTIMPTKIAVVLTAIRIETEAVLRHLENPRHKQVAGIWFQTGRFGSWTVAHAETGPGNLKAATTAASALTHLRPEVAAFVGVAGGVKDVDLGDVIVATKVYSYESGKETADGFHPRPDAQHSNRELEQRARLLSRSPDWHAKLSAALWPDRKPRVHVGPIASGESVVADDAGRIATLLKLHYGDTLAVEMEGYGFLEAARADSTPRRCGAGDF